MIDSGAHVDRRQRFCLSEDQVQNGWLEIFIRTRTFAPNRGGHTSQEIPDNNIHEDLECGQSVVGFAFVILRLATNPTEKDKDVFEKDTPPFSIEGPVVGEDSCSNDEVVEHKKGDESPIQRRSPVLIKIRRSRSHRCHIRTRNVPKSQESGQRRTLTKSWRCPSYELFQIGKGADQIAVGAFSSLRTCEH